MADIKILNLAPAAELNDSDILIVENITKTQKATVGQLKEKFAADFNTDRLDVATEDTIGVVKGGDIVIDTDGSLNLPSTAVVADVEEIIAEAIPRDAELLGGHDAAYFEALVQAVSERVITNLQSITAHAVAIGELNNNLASVTYYNVSTLLSTTQLTITLLKAITHSFVDIVFDTVNGHITARAYKTTNTQQFYIGTTIVKYSFNSTYTTLIAWISDASVVALKVIIHEPM